MADYVPTSDSDLRTFTQAYLARLAILISNEVMAEGSDTYLTNLSTGFGTLLDVHNTAQTAARTARQNKDAKRADLVKELRSLTRQLQANPQVLDSDRAALGITIPDTIPSYVPPPSSRPALAVDTSQRLQHTINFQDETTPLSRAKPYGAMGCEIYRKVGGDAPVSDSDWQFVGLDTATPYVATYAAEDGGKTVYYKARWVNRSGEGSPFSQVVSATIVA